MNHQILFAGFGGQGVLSMGKILAEAALLDGKEVTWLPSYGPEMRGGTSNVSVIISDEPVAAPIISPGTATAVVAMNRPSIEKFERSLAPGGLLLYDASMIEIEPARSDIQVVAVDANAAAQKVGSPRSANMVLLGVLIAQTGAVSAESAFLEIEHLWSDKPEILKLNRKALELAFQKQGS